MSTDEKPTNCDVNSLFYELDTGDFYYFNGVWKKVGESATLGSPDDTDDTGTIQITENDVYDVTDYDYADVNVPGVIPVGTSPILENGTVDVTNYATAEVDVDYVTINFNLPAFKRTSPAGLSQARRALAATTVSPTGGSNSQSSYALFGGGASENSVYSVVDAYDTSLIRTTPTALSMSRYYLAATNIGNYALFGGGSTSSSLKSSRVDAYDTSLTRTTPTALSEARRAIATAVVGNYALFGGGGEGSVSSSVVDAYDESLTLTTPTVLSLARDGLAATTVVSAGGPSPQSSYALFGGGYDGSSYSSVVDAYDTSLTRTTPTELSQARDFLTATNVVPAGGSSPQSGYALFGGGHNGGAAYSTVDAYDTNLTRTTPTTLSVTSAQLSSTAVPPTGGSSPQSGYALFGGGAGDGYHSEVCGYDTSLTRIAIENLSAARSELVATTIAPAGESSPQSGYALFAGGRTSASENFSNVDAYSLASYDIQILPETKYNFNNSGEIFSDTMQTINIQGPVVGYVKIKNTHVVG